MLQCLQAHPLSLVDTGADAFGSGFHFWKRRTAMGITVKGALCMYVSAFFAGLVIAKLVFGLL